jgi:hypothetical protein
VGCGDRHAALARVAGTTGTNDGQLREDRLKAQPFLHFAQGAMRR